MPSGTAIRETIIHTSTSTSMMRIATSIITVTMRMIRAVRIMIRANIVSTD